MSNADQLAFSTSPRVRNHYTNKVEGGLTKRELFAAMAMQGLCANSFDGHCNQPIATATYAQLADMAVDHADALLDRLERKP